ncbi:MAG: hypothetical protein JWN44_1858 [Myxococcales bacterium]|nr:hypothetical protein [Myxococcales bacterium]
MLALHRDVLSTDERAQLRATLDAAGWSAHDLADRLHLATANAGADDALFARLLDLANRTTRPLRLRAFQWLRLRRGDYQLLKHDARERPPAAHVELIVDLSAAATGEAELVYTDGGATLFYVPQLPGSVAVIERPPALLRYQRYLCLRVADAEVHRLRLTLA